MLKGIGRDRRINGGRSVLYTEHKQDDISGQTTFISIVIYIDHWDKVNETYLCERSGVRNYLNGDKYEGEFGYFGEMSQGTFTWANGDK